MSRQIYIGDASFTKNFNCFYWCLKFILMNKSFQSILASTFVNRNDGWKPMGFSSFASARQLFIPFIHKVTVKFYKILNRMQIGVCGLCLSSVSRVETLHQFRRIRDVIYLQRFHIQCNCGLQFYVLIFIFFFFLKKKFNSISIYSCFWNWILNEKYKLFICTPIYVHFNRLFWLCRTIYIHRGNVTNSNT